MSTWKRGFLAAFVLVAVLAGALGSTAAVVAQEENETGTDGETDASPPIPDTIALYGVAAVVAVLSPIAFALFLALRYRGE